MKKTVVVLLLAIFLIFNIKSSAQTTVQQNKYQGVVVETEKPNEIGQKVKVEITGEQRSADGKVIKGTLIELDTGLTVTERAIDYKKGDNVLLMGVVDPQTGVETFYITDFNRTYPLTWLLIIFVIIVLLVSKKWGFYSLIGMLYSFFIIFKFILPLLLRGHSPLLIAISGCMLISPVTFYLSHGFNRKTTIALASTAISLTITGILSLLFINLSNLTGFSSDEAFFLQVAKEGLVNMKGIYLAGVIIGTLGVLDDVTVSQSAVVFQLKNSVRGIKNWELYKKAMEVGHDHITSMVNTLVLVYTGAALPLLLLFIDSTATFREAINSEIIADEIIRTLVGSIGLVLAVPISTVLAVYLSDKKQPV